MTTSSHDSINFDLILTVDMTSVVVLFNTLSIMSG